MGGGLGGGDQQWPGAQDTSRWTRTQGRIVGDNTKHELEPWQHKESAGLAKHTLISTFLTLFHYVIFSFFFPREQGHVAVCGNITSVTLIILQRGSFSFLAGGHNDFYIRRF